MSDGNTPCLATPLPHSGVPQKGNAAQTALADANTAQLLQAIRNLGGEAVWNAAQTYTPPAMKFGPDDRLYFALAPSGPGTAAGPKQPGAAGSGAYWTLMRKREFYIIGDELILYVRPDGNDENDGFSDTSGGAFATLDRALLWIREREFYGSGFITIRIADGTYSQIIPNGDASATFYDAPTSSVRHLLDSRIIEPCRVRIIGNFNAPQNVVYNFMDTELQYALVNAHVYGVTFRGGGPNVRRHCFMIPGGELTNCRYVLKSGNGGLQYFFLPHRNIWGHFSGSHHIVFEQAQTIQSVYHLYTSAIEIGTYNPTPDGTIVLTTATVSISGNVTVSNAFACAYRDGCLLVRDGSDGAKTSISGNVTGRRYYIRYPGSIDAEGKGQNVFPGTQAGLGNVPAAAYL